MVIVVVVVVVVETLWPLPGTGDDMLVPRLVEPPTSRHVGWLDEYCCGCGCHGPVARVVSERKTKPPALGRERLLLPQIDHASQAFVEL